MTIMQLKGLTSSEKNVKDQPVTIKYLKDSWSNFAY